MAQQYATPTSTLTELLAQNRFGEPHLTLAGDPTWRDVDERDTASQTVAEEARRAGLTDNRGRIHSDVYDLLPLLAHGAHIEFYGWITDGNQSRSVLVAAAGSMAVLAVRAGQTVRFTSIRNHNLAETLVRQLPQCRPGGGGTFNVRLADLTATTERSTGYTRTVLPNTDDTDLILYRNLMAHEQRGCGELSVAVRTPAGRTVTRFPLRYVDISLGRWFLQQTGNSNDPWIVGAPATNTTLVERLKASHQQLAQHR